MILNESKRDNLLLPYLQILQERGINMTLGQFKTKMLQKLSNEGPLTNLSLDSNFYLAGAVRYYFNGDLTLNKDLSIFKSEGEQDQWNIEIGQQLNALIKILRNVHIDSIGTTMEQPEDFGELTLPKLLRKYGAKIKKELGIDIVKDEKDKPSDGIDRNPNVGNGYTYEILYNHSDATKYNAATSPGAWCITYDTDTYYNMYIRRLGIHYVIFRQNGWEKIDRVNGLDKSRWKGSKPQDPYGNSLIAVLQSNTDGRMIYITSRWNHGYGDDNTCCEADHAYTDQEFYDITGVTPEDMQRIFKIWKKDAPIQQGSATDRTAENKKKQGILRALKYIQMRINGGESPDNLVTVVQFLNGDGWKITKSLVMARYSNEEGGAVFLMDKGKIIFDTIIYDRSMPYNCVTPIDREKGHMGLKDAIIWRIERNKFMVYNIRLHKLLDIEGINKFKSMPTRTWIRVDTPDPTFYEIKMAHRKIAFVNYSNNIPLKLPNGQNWFYEYHVNSGYYRGTHSGSHGGLETSYRDFDNTTIIEILYDPASREKYFYSVQKHSFINVKDDVTVEKDGQIAALEPVINTDFRMEGLYSIGYQTTEDASREYGRPYSTKNYLFTINGEQVSIEGISEFSQLRGIDRAKLIVCWSPDIHTKNSVLNKDANSFVYDNINKQILKDEFGPIACEQLSNAYEEARMVAIRPPYRYTNGGAHPHSNQYYYLFDTLTRQLVKNPCGWPSKHLFRLHDTGDSKGNGIKYIINNDELIYPIPEGGRPNVKELNLGNDTISQMQNQQPAVQLAENEIYTMVSECVKKILKYGSKRTNK